MRARAFDKKSLIRILEEAAIFYSRELSLDGKVGLKIMEIMFDNRSRERYVEVSWRKRIVGEIFFFIVEEEVGEIKFGRQLIV